MVISLLYHLFAAAAALTLLDDWYFPSKVSFGCISSLAGNSQVITAPSVKKQVGATECYSAGNGASRLRAR